MLVPQPLLPSNLIGRMDKCPRKEYKRWTPFTENPGHLIRSGQMCPNVFTDMLLMMILLTVWEWSLEILSFSIDASL